MNLLQQAILDFLNQFVADGKALAGVKVKLAPTRPQRPEEIGIVNDTLLIWVEPSDQPFSDQSGYSPVRNVNVTLFACSKAPRGDWARTRCLQVGDLAERVIWIGDESLQNLQNYLDSLAVNVDESPSLVKYKSQVEYDGWYADFAAAAFEFTITVLKG